MHRAAACVQQLEDRRYLASINGDVYNDVNGNGAHDSNEPGIQGVIINIDKGADGSTDYTAVTDVNGSYSLAGLPADTYRVRQQLPDHNLQTSADPPDFVLALSTNEGAVDFNDFQDVHVHGVAFDDSNGDGSQDVGELPIGGAQIGIDSNADGVPDSTVTADSTGRFDVYLSYPITPGTSVTLIPGYGYIASPNGVLVNGPSSGQDFPISFGEQSQFVVTNTNDTGIGSLRNAIQVANLDPGSDTPKITFDIDSDGVQTITPLTALPKITHSVTIDATTQPGYAGTPLIALTSGSGQNIVGGIYVSNTKHVTIQGLAINEFGVGIRVEDSEFTTIESNYLGISADGTSLPSSQMDSGVEVLGSEVTIIGGLDASERNVISNNGTGVDVAADFSGTNSDITLINGDYIGTDATGNAALGTQTVGVEIENGATITYVGGSSTSVGPVIGNVISGQSAYGIVDQGHSTSINGNLVGVGADGSTPIPNALGGALLESTSGAEVGSLFGLGGTPNVFACNGNYGIGVFSDSEGNILGGNTFFSNVGLGIDLDINGVTMNDDTDADTGGNGDINFPVLTSAISTDSDTVITGTFSSLPNAGIPIFLTLYTSDKPDSSGYGEGKTILYEALITADANGNATLNFDLPQSIPADTYITATAGSLTEGTSEFSKTFEVTSATPPTPPPAFSINDVTHAEGNSGTKTFTFTVSRDSDAVASTVDYITGDGSATAGEDYIATSGTLTFAAGQSSQTVVVTEKGDTKVESDETFFVDLSNATNATIVNGEGTGTIQNDDSAPVPSKPKISIGDASITEGNSGTKTLTFTVTLDKSSGSTIKVNYATANGTASSSSDYTAKTGTLTFTAGQTSKTISITIKGDTTVESDETFKVNLSSPTNATIDDGSATGTIKNDDSAPSNPSISINDVSTTEGNSGTKTLTFTVKLSKASTKAVTVKYTTTDGTAKTSDNDYKSKSGTLTFAPGQTSLTISITIVGDKKKEGDEDFAIDLSGATNGTISDAIGLGTVKNDD